SNDDKAIGFRDPAEESARSIVGAESDLAIERHVDTCEPGGGAPDRQSLGRITTVTGLDHVPQDVIDGNTTRNEEVRVVDFELSLDVDDDVVARPAGERDVIPVEVDVSVVVVPWSDEDG